MTAHRRPAPRPPSPLAASTIAAARDLHSPASARPAPHPAHTHHPPMSTHPLTRLAPVALALLAAIAPAGAQQVDYHRAEMLLGWHTSSLVSGTAVSPNWINDSDRFWYRNNTGSGHEFTYVDPVANLKRPLFDHARLAAALSVAADTSYVPDKLPFDDFDFVDGDEGRIAFETGARRFECELGAYLCTVGDTLDYDASADDSPFVESPDGRWAAFVMDHNLYVRSVAEDGQGSDTIQLTTDGEEFNGYGLAYPRPNDIRNKRVRRPGAYWSPDSRKLVVQRMDQRGVEHHHYVSYTPQRTVHYSQPYALPGDSIVPLPAFHILDLAETLAAAAGSDGDAANNAAEGKGADNDSSGDFSATLPAVGNIRVELQPRPNRLYLGGSQVDSLWSADSRHLYMHWETRGSKSNHLAEVDAATGDFRIIASDSARTFVETAQRNPTSWFVSESTDDAFWWSERDGWAHIWRFGKDGAVKNQVTRGPWAVGAIWHVDESNRQIYFTAYGREEGIPYYGRLYRVGYDGGGLTTVAGEVGNHAVNVSPSGRFVVDSYSTIGDPPVSLLRNLATGSVVRTLEEADISRLEAVGWRAPEVFTVKARDGVTDIHGLIYFPDNLSPDNLGESGSYPVIDHIYPGPQVGSVGSWSFKSGGEDFALAKLGFVVIQLDHMGTPHRSKAFHDIYYGDFNDNGLPDHVTAIKQLAARYPFMDLDRVGIYGHSGGGFASTDAMVRFPDFFKVAVSGAGNHDNASYNIYWAEKYQGLLVRDSASGTTNFTDEANKTHVANLKGKLLLMHGDMDDNVHPSMTVQLINELTKANKDYDLVWAPDRAHGLNEPYFIRRRWDYFVTHLLGAEPPKEYEITRPEN